MSPVEKGSRLTPSFQGVTTQANRPGAGEEEHGRGLSGEPVDLPGETQREVGTLKAGKVEFYECLLDGCEKVFETKRGKRFCCNAHRLRYKRANPNVDFRKLQGADMGLRGPKKTQERESREKAKEKIGMQFPRTVEGALFRAVVFSAIDDIGISGDAEGYLKSEYIPHAEICGVDSDWIRRVLFEAGLLKNTATMPDRVCLPFDYMKTAKELEDDTQNNNKNIKQGEKGWSENSPERAQQLRIALRCRTIASNLSKAA